MRRTTFPSLFILGLGSGLGYLAGAGGVDDTRSARAADESARSGLLAPASTAVPPAPAGAVQEKKRPNIVVIWGDDIGQSNISAYSMGLMGYRTPNIDRIAKEGMIFTDYYAEQSCTAGRASFITGQHGLRTGLTKVGIPGLVARAPEAGPDDRRADQAARATPPGSSARTTWAT